MLDQYLTTEALIELRAQRAAWKFPESENNPHRWANRLYEICAAVEPDELTSEGFLDQIMTNVPPLEATKPMKKIREHNYEAPNQLISIFASIITSQRDALSMVLKSNPSLSAKSNGAICSRRSEVPHEHYMRSV